MKFNSLKWLLILIVLSNLNYANDLSDKTVVCSACHGKKGLSPNQLWPNIAGQNAKYLTKQLNDFKLGKDRFEPTMSSMVANLTSKDFEELANYYASQKMVYSKQNIKSLAEVGARIYKQGDLKKHITACIACHGPHGEGNSSAGFPSLAGQMPLYTFNQLKAFKNKSRKNDINQIMRDISSHMSIEDMQAVADYIRSVE
jgi:cytochrome c553